MVNAVETAIKLEETHVFMELADPDSDDGKRVLEQLSATLLRLTGCSGVASFRPEYVASERSCFVIARDPYGKLIGCCALREMSQEVGEVKRMFAAPHTNSGAKILGFIEEQARRFGYSQLRLATRRVNQRAMNFYSRQLFVEIKNYDGYSGRDEFICYAKDL